MTVIFFRLKKNICHAGRIHVGSKTDMSYIYHIGRIPVGDFLKWKLFPKHFVLKLSVTRNMI